jgi:putative transposase
MKKTARKGPKSTAPTTGALLPLLHAIVRRDLREFVVDAGMTALADVLEQERAAACGPRYAHQPERHAFRAGHATGELVLGGRRVQAKRPRARTVDGEEVTLPSWRAFSSEDPLHERALEQALVGVSTRRYARSLEDVPAGVRTRGVSRSAVSRRFVSATEQQMAKWLGRDLSEIDLVVLMVDGVYVDDHVILAALGIDAEGKKHVLGVREGATENSTACTALLGDLRERGMRTDQTTLAVLDGSKALAKSVREVFGGRALIQRCQAHKARNVLDQLPEDLRPSVREALRQAYGSGDAVRAKRLLGNLARRLRDDHPSAAASLDEGLDETLTVMRLRLPRALERTLCTTNAVENLIGSVRGLGRRVKRWRDGRMIVRWTVAAVVDAATRFRRVRGATEGGMLKLVLALRGYDATNSALEPKVNQA